MTSATPPARLPASGTANLYSGTPPVKETNSSGDAVLTALLGVGGPIADVVRAYPGRDHVDGVPAWLEAWFQARAIRHLSGAAMEDVVAVAVEPIASATADERPRTCIARRLLTVEPRWFRGFRRLKEPIRTDADLLLIDGRNSTGKTSLAEALEWLFKGELARRALGGHGNAKELEGCVGNRFRPADEETWVAAAFELDHGGTLTLRRVLDEDYGSTIGAVCRSRLFCDERELSGEEAMQLLDEMFGGAPPLLMQHTLRLFVHNSPSQRRDYFERLLRLDELASLIEKAVVGAGRIDAISHPADHGTLSTWKAFKEKLTTPAERARLTRIEKLPPGEIAAAIYTELPRVARVEFGLDFDGRTYSEVRAAIEDEQRAARQRRFPLLSTLKPTRVVDAAMQAAFSPTEIREQCAKLTAAVAVQETARASAKAITDAQIAIAAAVSALTDAGLVPTDGTGPMTCPVCEYQPVPTLSPARVRTVRTWDPIRTALAAAELGVKGAAEALVESLRALLRERRAAFPDLPADEAWDAAMETIDDGVKAAATAFRDAAEQERASLAQFDGALVATGKLIGRGALDAEAMAAIHAGVDQCATAGDNALASLRRYADAFKVFDRLVGNQSGMGEGYAARERWLNVGGTADHVADDLAWAQAKDAVGALLANVRTELKSVRQELLERRRTGFNDGISDVWSTLRGDTYSVFSHLHIPEPRGKGYKVEIEVKALLDDGTTREEVDALRVFSESQVNALGIAAFITRAKMLDHRLLIFDDPVQSMDEEHFATFAKDLVPQLVDSGFQVILLTHNEQFALEVCTAHSAREGFASCKIVHSKRDGSTVDIGHRRLRERLVRAERALEKGELENAWVELRKGTERLLTVLQTHHGGGVPNVAWYKLTGGQMFKQSGEKLIRARSPKFADRLHDIIGYTADGAHNTAVRGETDFRAAVRDVREIAKQFQLVD